jgi:GntR family transcriptional regulator/MocR family aminotransferase
LALLDWAVRNKAWIIVDDSDGEYRYISRPVAALKSLDHDGRVLYSGTFSKVLFPGIRIAYLVVPDAQVERFEQIIETFAGGTPTLTQSIVSNFISEGHFARHIQRMRKLYAERRAAVTAGLGGVLKKRMRIDSPPGGMHLILRMRAQRSDRRLVSRMREDGLYGEAMSDWMMRGTAEPALLVGFTNIASQGDAEKLGRRILKLL